MLYAIQPLCYMLFSLYVICYLAFMLYAIYDYSPISDTQNHGVPLFTLYSVYKTDENINYKGIRLITYM